MLKPDRIIIERRPDSAYVHLFPYYVELCATSQFRSKLKGEGGILPSAVWHSKGGRTPCQLADPAQAQPRDGPAGLAGAASGNRKIVARCPGVPATQGNSKLLQAIQWVLPLRLPVNTRCGAQTDTVEHWFWPVCGPRSHVTLHKPSARTVAPSAAVEGKTGRSWHCRRIRR